jgi:predicted acylesterase/phospholipase RssA
LKVSLQRFFDAKHKSGVVVREWELIRRRRINLSKTKQMRQTGGAEDDPPDSDPPQDIFGIALSGGGIRSATFNLGFLRALNARGLLRKADYLSTVSGGGYIGAYVQEHLRTTGSYATLFVRKEMERLRDNGDYLRPGKGVRKWFENINFIIAVVGMTLLHLLWYLLLPPSL